MTDRLAIYLLLAGCLILGAIVVIEIAPAVRDDPLTAEIPGRPNAAPPAMHRPPSERIDELLATVLARPLFSSTRRPPQSAVNDGGGADFADTRLTGIVTEPSRHIAIFAVNGAKALRLTEGEAVSGWRIESITPREVSLSGPGGSKTLEPKVDPNLVPSAPGPAPAATAGARPGAAPASAAAAPPRPGVSPTPGLPPPRPARAQRRQ
jgi:general secretion pathway protein N